MAYNRLLIDFECMRFDSRCNRTGSDGIRVAHDLLHDMPFQHLPQLAPGPFSTRPSSVLSLFPCIRSFFSLLILFSFAEYPVALAKEGSGFGEFLKMPRSLLRGASLSLSPNAGYTGPQWKEPCVDNR